MINEAIEFAAKAHEGQLRKGTKKPYIVHPIEVSEIVSAMTDDEEVICAAVLHDTIEDCRGITKDVLKLRFGDRVAELVAQESEDKTLSWKERKSATISNMRDIDRDYPVVGEKLWERFRMKSKAALEWYYKGVRDALKENFSEEEEYKEYCGLIEKNFGSSEIDMSWDKQDV